MASKKNSKCARGKILRKGYIRKAYIRSDGTRVKRTIVRASCVPDKGKKGKTPKSRKVLPVPVKGALSKYGYSNIKHTADRTRRIALAKSVKNEGYTRTIRRLLLISNYNKRSDPETHKILLKDMDWMRKKYRL